jgi:hypothetical protein
MEITTLVLLEDMPLTHVVRYLDSGEVYLFALTCSTSLALVQAVHKGAVRARALQCFFPTDSALLNYACDCLAWKGESMQRDGWYWLECAASRGGVDKARALKAFGCAWDVRKCEIIAKNGHVELLKWMRAQPPCPCDFEVCLELAEEGGAVQAYLQIALHLLMMCMTETKDMTATKAADAVALVDQGTAGEGHGRAGQDQS